MDKAEVYDTMEDGLDFVAPVGVKVGGQDLSADYYTVTNGDHGFTLIFKQALMNGIPAIAFSKGHNGSSETADAYLPLLMEDLMQTPLPPNEIWNVNFPGLPLEECKGILIDRMVAPIHPVRVWFEREDIGNGSFSLSVKGNHTLAEEAPENSDVRAVLSGYVSVGTVRCNVL